MQSAGTERETELTEDIMCIHTLTHTPVRHSLSALGDTAGLQYPHLSRLLNTKTAQKQRDAF